MPPALPAHDLRMASNPVSAIQSWSLGRTVVRWYCWWDHLCFQRNQNQYNLFYGSQLLILVCAFEPSASSWILRSRRLVGYLIYIVIFSPRSYYFQIMQTSVPPGAGLLTNVLTITPIIFWFTKRVISFSSLNTCTDLYCRGSVLGYWLLIIDHPGPLSQLVIGF